MCVVETNKTCILHTSQCSSPHTNLAKETLIWYVLCILVYPGRGSAHWIYFFFFLMGCQIPHLDATALNMPGLELMLRVN